MQYEQEGMKKRGKNVCRENPGYHADTDVSVGSPLVGKTLQQP